METTKAKNILKTVLTRAWEDELFKKQLIENPIGVIEKLTGAKVVIPEGKELIFTDQSDRTKIYVNIPYEPDMEDSELTTDQLEQIAGGAPVSDQLIQSLYGSITKYFRVS